MLGASQDAVRKRVARGTLDAEKLPDGTVLVWVDTDPDGGADGAVHPTQAHVETLERYIARLESELTAEREASRETRHLLAAALGRIPAIDAAETPRAPESADEEPTGTDVPPAPLDRETASSRPSWWRRFFGA